MEEITQITKIREIREKLELRNLSVLIGAGFSKNVSNMFPNWSSLLYDLVKELYEPEINDSYNTYLASLNKKTKSVSKMEFRNFKITEIINKIGYLDVVSEYIKRKGYREAITTYIEEKTPHIIYKDGKLFLQNKLKSELLTTEMLFQHKLLLQLPWNNVYTTNYDKLLENCVDWELNEKLELKIKEIQDKNYKLLIRQDVLTKRKKNISKMEVDILEKMKKIRLEQNGDIQELVLSNNISEANKSIFYSKLKKNELRVPDIIKRNNTDLDGVIRTIKDNESLIKQFKKDLNELYTKVEESSKLSIKRNKNIIKLHGTLRSKNTDKFGFDRDIHKQYVIAKEDYETYPKKHEAFTQLMRISLLQESFVLIGFSGVDPNFISWISWVRDILEREDIIDDYKIYLIDVSDDVVTLDRELFFNNHRIIRIPIMDNSVIEFLQSETKLPVKDYKNKKEVVTLFLKYLSNIVLVDNAKSTSEQHQIEEYKNLWNSIKSFRPNDFDPKSIPKISEIDKFSTRERFPSLNFSYSHNKSDLLFFSAALLEKLKYNIDGFQSIMKLIDFAIKDSFLIVQFIWDDEQFEKIKKIVQNTELYLELDKSILRNYVLIVDNQKFNKLSSKFNDTQKEFVEYEEILLAAFNFDFDLLNEKLKKWAPQDYKVLNKAGLLALFDINKAESLLKEYSDSFENETNQEQLYVLKLLHYIERCITPWSINKDLNRRIKAYEESGLKNITENLDYLIDEFENNKTKIKPYGDGRFTITNSRSFSNGFSKPQEGLQFIQILIESGFPICLPNTYLISHEKWYLIFKSIYEYYPYPCLFFSLQYSDKDFIKRVAQDYIYSGDLKDIISEIISKLLDAYNQNNTPWRFKDNILISISELIIASPSNIWQKKVNIIWNSLKKDNQLFHERHNNHVLDFISKALLFIEDSAIIRSIICDILSNLEENPNIAIEYLYRIAQNKYFDKNKNKFSTKKLNNQINEIINKIPENPNNYMFALGNLNEILTDDNKNDILKSLLKTDFNIIKNDRVWHVILYFANNDKILHGNIKKAIIKNESLWYTGISGYSVSYGRTNFIILQNLRKNNHRENGLTFTKNEAIKIFDKLQVALNDIKRVKQKMDDINFESILEEMYQFVFDEENKINQLDNYSVIREELKDLYFKERGYLNLNEGLVSNDKTVVILSLAEVFSDIYRSNKLIHKEEIKLTLNKIIFQKEPSVEAALSHVSNLIWDFRTNKSFKVFAMPLVGILRKYKTEELIEYDKPFVQEKLIKIAMVLKYWSYNDESILYWKNTGKESVYNNIIKLIDTTI